MTEKQWSRVVVGLAKTLGYHVYYTWSSIHSPAGYPDLTLARPAGPDRPGRLLFVELKTETGRISPAQQEWLEVLHAAGGECHVWRPDQLEEIAEVLA